jgi:Ca2+-binding RTX toxin-like protein
MSGGKDTLLDISYVVGSMANDSFSGNNTFYDGTNYYESEFAGLQGVDTIKGGIFTRITYAFDPFAVSVNLDKKNITNLKSQVVAKGTAIDGFSTIDKLINISGVRGSLYDDFINGGLKAESFNGNSGNDLINGNGGDDLIWGFTGEDKISGGLGIDLLVGDHYINQTNIQPREADHFIFQNATESSGNKKMMAILESNLSSAFVGDIVLDLSAGDIVDLSGIDADSIQSGNQTFTFTAGGVFTKKAGEIIVQNANLTLSSDSSNNNYHFYSSSFRTSIADNDLTNTGVLLMGDVNGDGAADFSIFFVGVSSTTIFNNTFLL